MSIKNPPIDGFKVEMIRGSLYYSRHPVKINFVCRCGMKIDAWPDLIEEHKRSCKNE